MTEVKDIQRTYKNSEKTTVQSKRKWAEKLNRPFCKEIIQTVKRNMKKYSPSLIIKQTQIKTTLRYHLLPVRLANIEKTRTSVREDIE